MTKHPGIFRMEPASSSLALQKDKCCVEIHKVESILHLGGLFLDSVKIIHVNVRMHVYVYIIYIHISYTIIYFGPLKRNHFKKENRFFNLHFFVNMLVFGE